MIKNIEIELRGLLSKEKYEELCKIFEKKGKFKYDKDRIGICYPDPETGSLVEECKTDIRIRTTNGVPEIIIKVGDWGNADESRREMSLVGKKGEFDKMVMMLAALGHKTGVIVVRKGIVYDYKGVEFSLVEVPNHSYYFEAEVMASNLSERENAIKKIRKVCEELGLSILDQQDFFSYINKLNAEANESFDYAKYEEGYFHKRFGI